MRNFLLLCGTVLLSLAATAVVQADNHQNIGSIRGTVYQDLNRDGRCGPGDPIVVGIPIEFVSDDGQYTTYLQSGDNGTYGLVAAGLGTWKVSARPNANEYRVTSAVTRQAFIGEQEPLVLGIDFCVAPGTGTPGGSVLPRAGAAASSAGFVWSGLLGMLLIGLGTAVEWQRKR